MLGIPQIIGGGAAEGRLPSDDLGGWPKATPQIIDPNPHQDGPHNSPADSPPDSHADSPQTAPNPPQSQPPEPPPDGPQKSLVYVFLLSSNCGILGESMCWGSVVYTTLFVEHPWGVPTARHLATGQPTDNRPDSESN